MGETLRRTEKLRSRGPPVSTRRVGTTRAGIEDEPKPVPAIQLARLDRNVGSRVMQAEIRLERRFLRLAVDRPVPVLVESIEHDPLEPGDSPHLLNDDV